ncbi:MAG: response regulator transcription factor, partial [Bacteroidota bacterium]
MKYYSVKGSLLSCSEKNINIIYEASDGGELIDFLRATPELPDIILLDLKMPVINGIEATKIIHFEFPQLRIIALSSYNTKLFIANMI